MSEELLDYALTTVARIKDRLTITGSNHDAELLRLINGATDFIQSQTNRKFLSQELTETHSFKVNKPDTIFLKNRPVTAIASVKYRVGLFDAPNFTAIPTTDYALTDDGEAGIIDVQGWLYKGTKVAQVVYTSGYLINWENAGDNDTHTLPADITELCEKLVVRTFKRREDEGKESISMNSPGGGTTRFLKELTEEDKVTISKYMITPAFL